jgi:hypothetical protein
MSLRLSQLAVKRVAAAPVRWSRSAGGGGTHYNPPTGYLFGEKVSFTLYEGGRGKEVQGYRLVGDEEQL